MPTLVLASASPRRRELLARAGLAADVELSAEIDETALKSEQPGALAQRLALAKAREISRQRSESYVLGADTVVGVGRRILPKPEDSVAAARCLALLSGRRHRVYTGVCVVAPGAEPKTRLVTSTVVFKRLSEADVRWYLDSGEWQGKAGGYAIQGRAARFVRALSGSYTNVVGLPIFETIALLEGLGFPVRANPTDIDA